MDGNQSAKTHIAEDIEITGSVKCSSNIQLDGKLNGDLTCGGTAIIGNAANVKGNIASDSTSVLGQVNGNIAAKDRIELKASARMNGDIRAKRLIVEDGATFVGKSEVNPSGAAASADSRSTPRADSAAGGQEPAPAKEADARGKSGALGRK